MLKSLYIETFRNINTARLTTDSKFNFILGKNGSGKTSILECIYVLSSGRSFRTKNTPPLVNNQSDKFVVSGKLYNTENQRIVSVGLSKGRSTPTIIRIDGEDVKKSSQLADLMPVQVITPNHFVSILGESKLRRKVLDWGVFHVEHSFTLLWTELKKLLRQRNKSLQVVKRFADLAIWDRQLLEKTEELNQLRVEYFDRLALIIKEYTQRYMKKEVLLSYYSGWERGSTLAQCLERQFENDKNRGYTQSGFHRMDLRIRAKEGPITDSFSRGEQKLFSIIFTIANIVLIGQLTPKKSILLVDDMASEFDENNLGHVMELISENVAQVFITGTDINPVIKEKLPKTVQVFHVEHGKITC